MTKTMKETWELHKCEKCPTSGVEILYSMDNVERKAMTWRLIIRREATEADLEEDTYLEEEGETLWETSLEILHCPYCGKSLLENQDEVFEDHGRFRLYDFSGWKMDRR